MSGRSGSHVHLSKMTPEGKVGTVVLLHTDLKIGTLRRVLKLANVDVAEFDKYLEHTHPPHLCPHAPHNHASHPVDAVATAIGSHPKNTRLFLDGLAACDLVTKKDSTAGSGDCLYIFFPPRHGFQFNFTSVEKDNNTLCYFQ
ncbi:MAG: type II toxin-antitoxin system HicA family toxin [Methanosarcinales archaeon]